MALMRLADIVRKNEEAILKEWIELQVAVTGQKVSVSELSTQCREFLRGFAVAAIADDFESLSGSSWKPVKELLATVSKTRTLQGFSPTETAIFIFSLKKPIFAALRSVFENDVRGFGEEMWRTNAVLDMLGLYTVETYVRTREEIIVRQQQEMLELSTPVVKLWDGILGLPMIGTLDSSRTQVVMESLLQKIVETGSEIAIIDITGVPTVDTLVAQHLMKTVAAARLMGAECIISGIRPQIAATIVHLGVDLGNIITKATLADAFAVALSRMGRTVQRVSGQSQGQGRAAAKEARPQPFFEREVRA